MSKTEEEEEEGKFKEGGRERGGGLSVEKEVCCGKNGKLGMEKEREKGVNEVMSEVEAR